MSDTAAPRLAYKERLARARAASARAEQQHARIANLRLLVFSMGALGALAGVFGYPFAWGVAAAAVVLFVVLAVWHARIIRAQRDAESLVRYYSGGLLRLDDAWAGQGASGTEFEPAEHPYARDLNLFGAGSIYEQLGTARTRAGQALLAQWLLAPAPCDVIATRQEAVQALTPQLDWREGMALGEERLQAEAHPEALLHWAQAESPARPRLLVLLAHLLALGTALVLVVLVVALSLEVVPPWLVAAYLVLFAAGAVVNAVLRPAVTALEHGLATLSGELRVMLHVLGTIDQADFTSEHLRQLQAELLRTGAIAALYQLRRRIDWLDAPRNLLLTPVSIPGCWPVLAAQALEHWRTRHAGDVSRWLAAMGEIDALCALATYAFERPEDAWPVVTPGPARFAAHGLGHPLLPRAQCVRNEVQLGTGSARLWLLSGSNMSGKSTLLRAIGLAAVLAQAGAPVRAHELRMSPLAVFATLFIQDSVMAGRSRFYTELLRLRDLINSPNEMPWLYLLDEILHGTNSHDRVVGAEAIARRLVQADAVGLITTHDLALTALVDVLAPAAENRHLADTWTEGELHFDYILKPGVVQKSNALALMRSVGIDVPEPVK